MTNAVSDFETGFRPTADQIIFAMEYMAESGQMSVIVAVNFPGKTRGVWEKGQTREAVMDGDQPVIWTDRDSAFYAFEHGKGKYGNALFRVYSDGHTHCMDEAD